MDGDDLELPRLLEEAVEQWGPPSRRAWLSRLPRTVAELAARWQLRVDRPYQPGGVVSWVAPATDPAGRALVLKVAWTTTESLHEPDALRAWAGHGAVRLHEAAVVDDGETTALLLERCDPGSPLTQRPALEQDEVVARVLRRLWEAPATGPFRPLSQMCEEWAAEFEEKLDGGGVPGGDGAGRLERAMVADGIAAFRALSLEAVDAALLVTDLHAGNVLAATREPWLVVDPTPYVGDRTYDPLQHLLNDHDRLLTDPRAFSDRVAALCDVDAGRLRAWLFARCVQESIDQPELAEAVRLLARGAG